MTDIQIPLMSEGKPQPKYKLIPLNHLPATEDLDLPQEWKWIKIPFIQDLMARGQREPIILTNLGDGRYFVEAGNKRIAAIREIHEELLPDNPVFAKVKAIVQEDEYEVSLLASVASNHQRHGNALTDLKAIRYLMKKYPNMSEKSMARALGMSLQTLKRRKKLFALNDILLNGLETGQIGTRVAEELSKSTAHVQAKAVELLTLGKKKISLDDVKETKKVSRDNTISAVSDQVFPQAAIPQLEVDENQISNEFTLLGITIMDEYGRILIPEVMDPDDPETEERIEKASKEVPGSVAVQHIYIYNK